ncbi:hypothetical protein O181_045726 [Austropuccinia psidii MF-1]|uniref:Integrase catalytic domain-containing protein n=1 Tax=Austropuccinia psidii MF-1 TaxID=1389203 RepID=A0A9Q3DKQ9_9BASI|nr:hypothetical protein [Austropuccinia psidii MF-1]
MGNQLDRTLKNIISDQEGKFFNAEFKNLFDLHVLVHIFSLAYIPNHSSFAKRENMTILEKASCLLNGSKLPNIYCAEAVSTSTHLFNLIPTPSRQNSSPYTFWTKIPPHIQNLWVFGCVAILIAHKNLRNWKLNQTGKEGILLGYKNKMSAYWVLWICNQKITISRHVIFNESIFPSVQGVRKDNDQLKVPGTGGELDLVDEICSAGKGTSRNGR